MLFPSLILFILNLNPFPDNVPSDFYIGDLVPSDLQSQTSWSNSRHPITHMYSRKNKAPSFADPATSPPLAASSSTSGDVDFPTPRYPQRIRKCLDHFGFSNTCYSSDLCSFLSSFHSLFEPTSYKEVVLDPLQQQAINVKLSTLHKTNTWDLVNLPSSKRDVSCRWVYKIKTKANGSIEQYNAHLVTKGYAQEYNIDYKETFAHIAKVTTIRTLTVVATVHQWSLSQMDVKNAFLNGDLFEKVYMVPLPDLAHSLGQVCKLREALHGLKQAPRAWFAKFSIVICDLGFIPSVHDSALFLRSTSAR